MRLEHINITVNNIEQSSAFYTRLFNFKKRWEGTGTGKKGPVRAIHIGNSTTYLSLFEAENPGQAPADYGVPGINHLAFEVEHLQPFRKRLAAMGVTLHLDENYEPGRRIYFYDPSGVEVELVAYGSQA